MKVTEGGKWIGDASISFELEGVKMVLDFISSDSFKIVTKRSDHKPDQNIEIGRKGEKHGKAINDSLNFANLSLEESAQVQVQMEQFIAKYFSARAALENAGASAVEECAAQ